MSTATLTSETKLDRQFMPMIGMLSAQLLLGMAENLMGKPADLHGFNKVLSGSILVLHVLIGLALIIRGSLALRLAMREGGRKLQASRLGFAGVVIAFTAGVLDMAISSGDSWYSYVMTLGFLTAFLAYGALLARRAN